MSQGFKDLRVWKEGMNLAKQIYRFIEHLPDSERYNLSEQLRRSAISVPSNIAEGRAMGTDGNFLQHVRRAQGSLAEMETQLLLATDLELTEISVPEELWNNIENLHQGLRGLRRYLNESS